MEQGVGTLSLLGTARRKWSSVLQDIGSKPSLDSDSTKRHGMENCLQQGQGAVWGFPSGRRVF